MRHLQFSFTILKEDCRNGTTLANQCMVGWTIKADSSERVLHSFTESLVLLLINIKVKIVWRSLDESYHLKWLCSQTFLSAALT